ncbi:hypothetical protein VPBB_A1566 [Vibrio parahaemolyticus BB22OP]|nr:hypothetical protein VPBB_A1566 [Vibrio parahaemolyticus BB22OP]
MPSRSTESIDLHCLDMAMRTEIGGKKYRCPLARKADEFVRGAKK